MLFHHVFVTKLFYLYWTVSVKHSVTVLPICCQLVYVIRQARALWSLNFPECYIYGCLLLHLLLSFRFRLA